MGNSVKALQVAPNYPTVLSEEVTLDMILGGVSCSRFGDGELRLAHEGTASAQVNVLALRNELRRLLAGPTKSLVCLPHYHSGPKADLWKKYGAPKFVDLMRQKQYGSAFISRPDSAPWINRPAFWEKVRMVWHGRDATLVIGTDGKSLNEHMLRDARSVRKVVGPRRDAYSVVDHLEKEIGDPPGDHPIIMCLGPTATVLAERLARKGLWAIDFGHIGTFMPEEFR